MTDPRLVALNEAEEREKEQHKRLIAEIIDMHPDYEHLRISRWEYEGCCVALAEVEHGVSLHFEPPYRTEIDPHQSFYLDLDVAQKLHEALGVYLASRRKPMK